MVQVAGRISPAGQGDAAARFPGASTAPSKSASAPRLAKRDKPTLGVRIRPVGRYVAERDTVTADTEYGPIRVKRKWLAGEMVSAAPEYDDIVNIFHGRI